jgi:hypothetical protein
VVIVGVKLKLIKESEPPKFLDCEAVGVIVIESGFTVSVMVVVAAE